MKKEDTYYAFDFEDTSKQLIEDLSSVEEVECELKRMPNTVTTANSLRLTLTLSLLMAITAAMMSHARPKR